MSNKVSGVTEVLEVVEANKSILLATNVHD